MVAGRKYWILIWYGILLLGVLGLWASLYWARRTAWKNVDEVLRAVGTILVSVGMLLLLHQPAGGAGGSASDIEIEAREILRMRDRLNRIFARETGQPIERIEEDTHRNFWLDADAAVKYGIVGKIISKASEL